MLPASCSLALKRSEEEVFSFIPSICDMSLWEYPSTQKRLNMTLLVSGNSLIILISWSFGIVLTSSTDGSGIFSCSPSSGTIRNFLALRIWSMTRLTVTLDIQDFNVPVGRYFPIVSYIRIILSCMRSRASSLSPTYLMHMA